MKSVKIRMQPGSACDPLYRSPDLKRERHPPPPLPTPPSLVDKGFQLGWLGMGLLNTLVNIGKLGNVRLCRYGAFCRQK